MMNTPDTIKHSVRGVKLLILLCAAIAPLQSQVGDWRREWLGAPPNVTELRDLDSTCVARCFDGLYAFDHAEGVWRYLGRQTMEMSDLQSMVQQPDGRVLVRRDEWVQTIDVRTGMLGSRIVRPMAWRVAALVIDDVTNDTIIGEVWDERDNGIQVVRARWTRLDSAIVVYDAFATLASDAPMNVPVMMSDTSMFVSVGNTAIVFPFPHGGKGRPTRVYGLPDTVNNANVNVWVDRGSQPGAATHLILRGRHSWMFTSDVANATDDVREITWTTLFVDTVERSRRIVTTRDADEVLVQTDSALFRYHIESKQRDTIVARNDFVGSALAADAGISANNTATTMVATAYTTMLVSHDSNGQTQRDSVHIGLPELAADDLMASTNGLLASTADGSLFANDGGEWSLQPIDYAAFRKTTGWNSNISLVGSRSTTDLWLTKGNMLHHFADNVLKRSEYLLLPSAKAWVPETMPFIVCITTLSDSWQVSWWADSSPLRILYEGFTLDYLVSFSDSVHVAIGEDGRLHRPLPGKVDDWIVVDTIPTSSGLYFRGSDVKGSHALVSMDGLYDEKQGMDVAVTHDEGRTWKWFVLDVEQFGKNAMATITNSGVVLVTAFVTDSNQREDLIVYHQDGAQQWMPVARLPSSMQPREFSEVTDIAYDDVGDRLYVTSRYWTMSVGVDPPVSVPGETVEAASSISHGIYDIMGRYIGSTREEIMHSGLYIMVTAMGSELISLSR